MFRDIPTRFRTGSISGSGYYKQIGRDVRLDTPRGFSAVAFGVPQSYWKAWLHCTNSKKGQTVSPAATRGHTICGPCTQTSAGELCFRPARSWASHQATSLCSQRLSCARPTITISISISLCLCLCHFCLCHFPLSLSLSISLPLPPSFCVIYSTLSLSQRSCESVVIYVCLSNP